MFHPAKDVSPGSDKSLEYIIQNGRISFVPDASGTGKKGNFVIQFDPSVEQTGELMMDSLIKNQNIKSKKRHASATAKRSTKVSNFRENKARDQDSRSPEDPPKNNKMAEYLEQSRRAKE